MIISGSVLLRMINTSDKSCRENQNTPLMINIFFFENPSVYEIMRKNTVKPDRPLMKIQHIHIACRIPTATNTHSEYVILTAFQQERAPLLRHAYIDCLVIVLLIGYVLL